MLVTACFKYIGQKREEVFGNRLTRKRVYINHQLSCVIDKQLPFATVCGIWGEKSVIVEVKDVINTKKENI